MRKRPAWTNVEADFCVRTTVDKTKPKGRRLTAQNHACAGVCPGGCGIKRRWPDRMPPARQRNRSPKCRQRCRRLLAGRNAPFFFRRKSKPRRAVSGPCLTAGAARAGRRPVSGGQISRTMPVRAAEIGGARPGTAARSTHATVALQLPFVYKPRPIINVVVG